MNRHGLEVLDGGLWSTVQDAGRPGYQQFGLPPGGALDRFAYEVGNLLVGNAAGAACLEMTLVGPCLVALAPLLIAVTGADLDFRLNDSPAPLWETLWVETGARLSFGAARRGCRAYLAVAGGVDVPAVLGSRSTLTRAGIGGIAGRPLRAGDRLPVGRAVVRRVGPGRQARLARQRDRRPLPLRVVLGPQEDYFDTGAVLALLHGEYRVSGRSDRMAYRLLGPCLKANRGPDIISDAIPLGAVQVPASGQPIVMLADRQTTGGYAKIATVISGDCDLLAQARPGDRVRFRAVSLAEAHAAGKDRQALLARIAAELEAAGPGARYVVATSRRTFHVAVEKAGSGASADSGAGGGVLQGCR